MSAGHPHKRENRKDPAHLRLLLQSPAVLAMFRRPARYVFDKDIPDLGGSSVDGSEFFIDRWAFREIMTGKADTGIPPGLTLHRLLRHERLEKACLDAGVGLYLDCHEWATHFEHEGLKDMRQYERGLRPLIEYCEKKPIVDPPLNLGCAPYLDDPDEQDKIILKALREFGVTDAFRVAKNTVDYSDGKPQSNCAHCIHKHALAREPMLLGTCDVVDGTVLPQKWCKQFSTGQGVHNTSMGGESGRRGEVISPTPPVSTEVA